MSTAIEALIHLLGDDDPGVVQSVTRELAALTESGQADEVRRAAEAANDPRARTRARAILEEQRYFHLADVARQIVSSNPFQGIEHASLLLSRVERPELDVGVYLDQFDDMAARLTPRLDPEAPSRHIIGVLTRFLAEEEGFRGDIDNPDDPGNSFLDSVMDRRRGLPITLSIVYLAVARRLGLPVHGVGLPGHFLLRYGSLNSRTFLDPFHRGRLLTRDDCLRMLAERGYGFRKGYFRRQSDEEILFRLVRNLILSFERHGNGPRLTRYLRIYGRLTADL